VQVVTAAISAYLPESTQIAFDGLPFAFYRQDWVGRLGGRLLFRRERWFVGSDRRVAMPY
jgi:hypothetical protein